MLSTVLFMTLKNVTYSGYMTLFKDTFKVYNLHDTVCQIFSWCDTLCQCFSWFDTYMDPHFLDKRHPSASYWSVSVKEAKATEPSPCQRRRCPSHQNTVVPAENVDPVPEAQGNQKKEESGTIFTSFLSLFSTHHRCTNVLGLDMKLSGTWFARFVLKHSEQLMGLKLITMKLTTPGQVLAWLPRRWK